MGTESLVLGGTSTRILVVGTDGRVRGRSTTGGGNPISHPAGAAAALAGAMRAALAGIDPRRVNASVVGVAGMSALRAPPVAARFGQVWADAGLTCDPGYAPDLEVAFAAGTPEPDGSVLVHGTGATAGAVAGHRLTRTADGHGWLLGDDGSGFWLGREAVRATLRRDRLIEAVNSRPGVQLSALAPLVSAAYREGDPEARSIVERAAAALLTTLGRIRGQAETTPIVLAGGLTGDTTPVGATLRTLLPTQFAGLVRPAPTGVGGAAWLALGALDPALATRAAHTRLCA
jgi:N-acetylglucosamine kinase-like BadF-type ATPase